MKNILDKQSAQIIKFPGSGTIASALKPTEAARETSKALVHEEALLEKIAKNTSAMQPVTAGGTDNSPLEKEIEDQKYKEEQIDLLAKIEKNTRGAGAVGPAPTGGGEGGVGIGGIGLIGTSIALALGSIAGVIQGQLKTIKFFAGAFEKGLIYVSEFFPKFKRVLFEIQTTFMIGVDMIKSTFSSFAQKIVKVFDDAVAGFKALFGEGTAIGKFISRVVTGFSEFFAPIIKSFGEIEKASKPIAEAMGFLKSKIGVMFEFFSSIGSKLGSFGKIFSAAANIIGKIAYPLMVIMTVWDTVKGMLAGFEEGGIIGGIKGAITGFVNSLILGPIELIKDATSWILGVFGFDKAAAFLDSFNLEDMFKELVDKIFYPVELIRDAFVWLGGAIDEFIFKPLKKMFNAIPDAIGKLADQIGGAINEYIFNPLKELFAPIANFFSKIKDQLLMFVEDFGIPEISFTIPIINKKVSIGPFYPFRPEAGSEMVRSSREAATTSAVGSDTASHTASTNMGFAGTESDKTTAVSTSTRDSMIGGKTASEYRALSAEFDTKTGKASYTSESTAAGAQQVYDKEISKSTFGKVKRMSARGEDTAAIENVIKEDAAYEKLGFFDKRKVDVGYAKATDLLALQKPETKTGEVVTTKSAANAGAAMATPAPAPVIISAPTTNNTSKQNITIPTPIRNDDSGFNRYMNKRSAII
jgi:hypothetical protein